MSDWADIHDGMEVTDRQIVGPILVTTGEHPQLGAVAAVQANDGMHVLTECLMMLSELVRPAEDNANRIEPPPVSQPLA